ncbi:cytidylyltransferase domain-containing protein [Rummeliibacillus pycnus]|uniref:cytidylyltransferase domain-containing protein n=1 Tax=Rummeliibacillus pycnus TaxID=101070 RepID=UPI000C99C4A1|nr:glycosyltransferase family protein [Rummeliibacillus pycnus]
MTVIAIIQARMGSTRLPGKILKEVNGKPLLLHQINRLKHSKLIDQLVIATTIEKQDDLIEDFCKKYNVSFFRGSENDVLARYYEASEQFGGDVIVRLTSDCPIIDPDIVDKTIQYYLENQFNYVSNTIERTYPRGLDTEVFSKKTLDVAYHEATLPRDREHVTAYIYTHPEQFSVGSFKENVDYSKYRWTVDTKEDLQLVQNILKRFNGREDDFTFEEAILLMKENPKWFEINSHIEQKKI